MARTLTAASPPRETVCIAFPEYIGDTKLPPSIATTSCTTEIFLRAASRAAKSLDCGLAEVIIIPLGATASIAVAQPDASYSANISDFNAMTLEIP